MDNPDHQDELLHVLSAAEKDPVRTNVVDMTRLQISRDHEKKTRKSHEQIGTLKGAKEGLRMNKGCGCYGQQQRYNTG